MIYAEGIHYERHYFSSEVEKLQFLAYDSNAVKLKLEPY